MDIIAWGVEVIKNIISGLGYPGLVLLMGLESACLPIPSEVVMPFAGWLAFNGGFNLVLVVVAGTVGCTLGSVVAYKIGEKGGRPFITRYGKYLFLNQGHVDATERWFKKYGDWAVFGSRLLPIVRTFISLPAGIAKMPFWRFVTLSTLGSLPWCALLAYIGYVLGENWQSLEGSFQEFEILVVVALVAAVAYFFYSRRNRRRNRQKEKDQAE
ncbi:MAG TPA: DedA family protein [Methanomassiliicoccales archaeon]|nr:DedA family protein [Methanomassiliicoccales archaeon]